MVDAELNKYIIKKREEINNLLFTGKIKKEETNRLARAKSREEVDRIFIEIYVEDKKGIFKDLCILKKIPQEDLSRMLHAKSYIAIDNIAKSLIIKYLED